jgi:hypothetical protein
MGLIYFDDDQYIRAKRFVCYYRFFFLVTIVIYKDKVKEIE